MFFKVANLAQLAQFDEIIDVRSPAEFAEDHIPGAINCPVLDNDERARVGYLYTQESPFAARKVGAVLVARNIALHIEQHFQDRPKSWRPLIYCWRGGHRSASMAIIMSQIGWPAHQLGQGYKTYRHAVITELEQLPAAVDFCVLCGPTGSGKSRLLEALARQDHQVLDLEQLAHHRGSVLGQIALEPQPSQKGFETALRQQLLAFDLTRPVYVEAESRTIGRLSLPTCLLNTMRSARCLQLEVPLTERVRFLLEDYDFFIQQPDVLIQQLERLKEIIGREQLNHWALLIRQGHFDQLAQALLECHYDPLYRRSTGKHYTATNPVHLLALDSLANEALDHAVTQLIIPH